MTCLEDFKTYLEEKKKDFPKNEKQWYDALEDFLLKTLQDYAVLGGVQVFPTNPLESAARLRSLLATSELTDKERALCRDHGIEDPREYLEFKKQLAEIALQKQTSTDPVLDGTN